MRESIPRPFTLSLNLNLSLTVGVAQGLERLAVAQEVAGSKPVTHPKIIFQFLYRITHFRGTSIFLGESVRNPSNLQSKRDLVPLRAVLRMSG